MSERKQTPDILAAILNGEAPATADFDAQALARATPPPRTKPQSKRAAVEKPAQPEKPAAPAKPRPSVQWAYQVLSFQENHGWRLRFIDDKEVRNWTDAATLPEMLVRMGEQGWELVSACSGEAMFGRADKYQLFFKRAAKND